MSNSHLKERKFLSRAEVARLIGVHPKTIDRWVQAGEFPKPIRYSQRTLRWNTDEVLRFRKETGI